MRLYEKIGVKQALKCFGGFVRYYDTTEPLAKLAELVARGDSKNVLACCAGGDQVLTILGSGSKMKCLWAMDINPSQLFVLAAKATFLNQKHSMPSFAQLQKTYPGKIAALKKNIRPLQQIQLYNIATGKMSAVPAALAHRYAFIMDGEMFMSSPSGPSWKKDIAFMNRIKAQISCLKLAQLDIFDAPEYIKPASLDLIYLSDIYWPQELAHYQIKLTRMAALLRPGGRILCYIDAGDDFLGCGVSPGLMLAQQAKKLNLRIHPKEDDGYLVLEKTR
jgi:hypothetical protein